MHWFLERIGAKSLSISFGINDKREHHEDFSKLIKKGVLKRGSNLDTVPCDLCDEDHECQVRESDGELCYVCENGCGKKILSDEELAVCEYDNDAFLQLIVEEFGIKMEGSFSDEAAYSENSFYRIGTWENKTVKAGMYYLRTDEAHEPSSLFEHLGNRTKVLITNTTTPAMARGKEGTLYCVLADALDTSAREQIFDAKKFKKCLEGMRRVQFNKAQGNLYFDGGLICSVGLGSPEHHFLSYLWDHWEEQVPHGDIHYFVREEIGSGVQDRAQIFCSKMKSGIKKKCSKRNTDLIDKIITTQTVGHYTMADPRE